LLVETSRSRAARIDGTQIIVVATYVSKDTRTQIARVGGTQVIIGAYDRDISTQSSGFVTRIVGARVIIVT